MRTSIGPHAPGADGPATDYEYGAHGRQVATIGPAVLDCVSGKTVRHRSETLYDEDGRVEQTWSNIRMEVNSAGETVLPADAYDNVQKTITTYDAHGRTVRTVRQGYAAGAIALSWPVLAPPPGLIHACPCGRSDRVVSLISPLKWGHGTPGC